MMWRFGENRLGWSPGHQGKGYVTADEDINTWNVDADEAPHHQEEWERVGETTQPAFLFDILPDGGIHDGGKGFRNATGKTDESVIAFLQDADPRLHDGQDSVPDFDLADDNPNLDPEYSYDYPIGRDQGFGHAYRLLDSFGSTQPQEDPLDELALWLESFPRDTEEQPLSPHHNSPEDFQHYLMPSGADYPALTPPDQVKTTSLYETPFNIMAGQGPVTMPDPPDEMYPAIYGDKQPRCSVCGQPTDKPGPCQQCAMMANPTKTGASSAYEWVARNGIWGYNVPDGH